MLQRVLFIPDGNRRFAAERGISLAEAYYLGGLTLPLVSEFFSRCHATQIIYHALSSTTFRRRDETLPMIWRAQERVLTELRDCRFFPDRGLSLRVLDQRHLLPIAVRRLCVDISRQRSGKSNAEVVVLAGYDVRADWSRGIARWFGRLGMYPMRRCMEFPESIDLVIRTAGTMNFSGGPAYACDRAEFIVVPEKNPAVTEEVLKRVIAEYQTNAAYRLENNPHTHR